MSLEYRIENREAFRVVGVMIRTTTKKNACMTAVPGLWGDVFQKGRNMEIVGLMNQQPHGLMGVSVYNTDAADAKKFDYFIACATDKSAPDGMVEYIVPAATWAVFPCKRAEIASVEVRIVTEWQPTSEFEQLNTGYDTGEIKSGAPDLEVYPTLNNPDNAEVWVAVRKK